VHDSAAALCEARWGILPYFSISSLNATAKALFSQSINLFSNKKKAQYERNH